MKPPRRVKTSSPERLSPDVNLDDNFEGKGTYIDDFIDNEHISSLEMNSLNSSSNLKTSNNNVQTKIVNLNDEDKDHKQEFNNISFFRFMMQTFSGVLGINFMRYKETMQVVGKEKINVHIVKSKDEIISLLLNRASSNVSFMKIDPLTYDLIEEARAPLHFDFYLFFEDAFCNFCSPFSLVYLYFQYGRNGLRNRHLITGVYPKISSPLEHDPEPPSVHLRAEAYSFIYIHYSLCKILIILSVYFGEYGFTNNSKESENKTHCPSYYLFLGVSVYATYNILLANKKALRSPESETRLLLAREKRNEELYNGWIPLPYWVVIFELRIAALKVGLDLNSRMYFKESESELRNAIGNKVLSYLENQDSISLDMEEANDEERTGIANKHVFDESSGLNSNGGSSCTVMALLLNGCLEQSYAHPAYDKDAKLPYGTNHLSLTWLAVVVILAVSPLLIDNFLNPYAVWDIWAVIIVSSIIPFFFTLNIAPQVFIYSALTSIQRKGRLQCFLNNILDPHARLNHYSKWRSKFPLAMDFNRTSNFNQWGKMRACILKFGYRYKQRTDINGGVIVSLLALITAFFIIFTALSTSRLYFWDIFFYAYIHAIFVISVGWFALLLALEGDECDTFCMKTKIILSNAILKFQDDVDNINKNNLAINFLVNMKRKNGKDVVNNSVIRESGGKLLQGSEPEEVAVETGPDLHAIRNNALLLHEVLAASEVLDVNMAMSILPMNKTIVTTIFIICFTQITLVLENTMFVKE